jgi:hypothetical protein
MQNKGKAKRALRYSAFIIHHLSFIFILAKFRQNAAGRFGMQEGDAQSFGALAGSLVDEADAGFLGLFKVAFKVFHGESDMVHTALAVVLLNESGDGAFGAGRLQKLDFGLAAAQKSGLHFLVGNFFNGIALGAKQLFKERNGLVQACDGDSNVFNVRWLHNYSNNLLLKNTYLLIRCKGIKIFGVSKGKVAVSFFQKKSGDAISRISTTFE